MKRSLHLFLFLFLASNASFLYAQTLLVATGSANAFSITYPANFGPAIPSGTMFTFQSNQSITGTATLNVNGAGAFTIKKNYNQNLLANDIKTGHFVTVIFDGTNWQMLSISGNPGGGIAGGGTASGIAFFTNASTLTADGVNFSYVNASNVSLSLGKIVLRSTSVSGDNLSIGANAGNNNITGNSNTMFGQFTGNFLTSGNENAFFGTAAGQANVNGSYNSFFGSGSGYNNTSGASNSIFGSDAGYNNTGSDNVFIGRRAGLTNAAGVKNVIIGSTADVTSAIYNNAIAIGYSATVGGSNMMALGGVNSFAVKVGIGTGTPANTLDIYGGLTVRNLSSVGTNLVQVDNNGNFSLANSASNYVFGSGSTSRLPYYVNANTLLTSSQFLFDGSSIAIGGATLNGNLPFQVQANVANPGISGTSAIAAGTAIAGSSSNVAAGSIGVTGSSSGAGTGVNATNGGAGYGLYALNAGTGYAGFFQQNSTGYAAAFMGGEVGIGTSTPGVLLGVGTSAGFAVNNTGNILSVNGINAVFPVLQGGSNTFLRNDGAGNLTWVAGGVTSPWSISGSNIFFNSGLVGIGTSVPGYKLDAALTSSTVNDAAIHGLIRTNVTGSNWAYAVYGEGYGGNTGRVAGIYGLGVSTSTGYGVGIYGVASVTGAGSGVLTGIWGEGSATNTNDNYGIYGRAGNSSTNNYAISSTVTASTGTSNNYGLYSLVSSVGLNNYGIFVTVAGTATNKYAAILMGGNVGIGITTPAGGNLVHAQSGSQNTIFAVTSNSASDAAGVRGENASATGDVAGVYGRSVSNSDFAAGVYGKISTAATTGQSFAIYGSHDGNGDYSGAVRGYHSGATGLVYGVQGVLASNSNPLSAAIAGIASGSAGFAGYFDSRLYVATALGIGTTTVGANVQLAIKDGHLRTMQTTAPTIVTGAAAGTTPSVSMSNATDVAGKITITSGTGTPTAGIYATITFNKAFTSTTSIIVIIVPTNLAAASKNVFISSTTATTFVVNFAVAAAASTAHTFNYFVIETQ